MNRLPRRLAHLWSLTRHSSGHAHHHKITTTTSTTGLTSPLELTVDHVSTVTCSAADDITTSFPNSLPKRFNAEIKAIGQACWLLRKQSYNIIQDLRKLEHNHNNHTCYMIYGSDGCGKTLALHQILYYCVKAGWMLIFIPKVFSWTHSPYELQPSSWQPGAYDQPEAASVWLKSFRSLNTHFTAQMRLSEDRVWGKKDHSPVGEEINKVIDKGLVKPAIATSIAVAVLEEVTKISQRFKVALAVDEFNGCFNPTSLKTPSAQWAQPEELSLVRALLKHIPEFPGPVLLSLSRSGMWRHSTTATHPHDLLGQGVESRRLLKHSRLVEVPSFTREEMETFVQFYAERKWVNRELTPTVLNEIWHITNGNPAALQKLCSSL